MASKWLGSRRSSRDGRGRTPLALATSFLLLAACQAPSLKAAVGVAAGSPLSGQPASQSSLSLLQPAGQIIQGRVIFPKQGKAVQAIGAQVVSVATVALIDTATGNTLAAGVTDASGNFILAPGMSFSPAPGGFYYLQVSRSASTAIGSNDLSMATVLEWTAAGWVSVTNATAPGTIVVNPTTTAVVLIRNGDSSNTAFSQIMGVVSGAPSYTAVTAFTSHSSAQLTAAATTVVDQLGQNTDPLGNLLVSGARMAPDDAGNATQYHVYIKTVSGVASSFIWVPVFTAYQLINPANCGSPDSTYPMGYWVSIPPPSGMLAPSGTSAGDYAAETFGGFYAGEFTASHTDAVPGNPTTGAGATAGSSATLKVAQYCVPWVSETWDQAAQACMLYDGHAHLMGDDEWTALAVWSMIRNQTVNGTNIGNTVYGNNAEANSASSYSVPSDFNNPNVTFVDDPTFAWDANGVDRALTGTGTDSAWPSGINLTTNTGTTTGVYDMNGNVTEWTDTLSYGDPATLGYFDVNDTSTGISLAASYINTLSTDPHLRRYGVPGSTSGSPTLLLGSDYFWITSSLIDKPLRGGDWHDYVYAGVWALDLSNARSLVYSNVGFRPVLRY